MTYVTRAQLGQALSQLEERVLLLEAIAIHTNLLLLEARGQIEAPSKAHARRSELVLAAAVATLQETAQRLLAEQDAQN